MSAALTNANEKPVLLSTRGLRVDYGVITALHEVSFDVREGEIVTLIGSNGAGKTTTLRAISGLVPVKSGGVFFQGRELGRMKPHDIVRLGIAHVPEGRLVFANLTVLENLRMGAFLRKHRVEIANDLEHVFTIFPRLKERVKQMAGTLSGGEQQMLAIGRALMSRPRFLMLDEPSLGIAPLLVRSIFETIVEINRREGLTILLVEQNANLALQISHRGCVIETGRVTLRDSSAALRDSPEVRRAYLGG